MSMSKTKSVNMTTSANMAMNMHMTTSANTRSQDR